MAFNIERFEVFSTLEKKYAPINLHRRLPGVCEDQIMDMSKVSRWVMLFSSGDSDANDKPHLRASY